MNKINISDKLIQDYFKKIKNLKLAKEKLHKNWALIIEKAFLQNLAKISKKNLSGTIKIVSEVY